MDEKNGMVAPPTPCSIHPYSGWDSCCTSGLGFTIFTGDIVGFPYISLFGSVTGGHLGALRDIVAKPQP